MSQRSRQPATEEEPEKEDFGSSTTTPSRYPGRQGAGLRHVSRFDPTRGGTTRPTISTSQVPVFGSGNQSRPPPVMSTMPVRPPPVTMQPNIMPVRAPTAGIAPRPEAGVAGLAQRVGGTRPGTPPDRRVTFAQPSTAPSSSLAFPSGIDRPAALVPIPNVPNPTPNPSEEPRVTMGARPITTKLIADNGQSNSSGETLGYITEPQNPDARFSNMNLPASAFPEPPKSMPQRIRDGIRNPFTRSKPISNPDAPDAPDLGRRTLYVPRNVPNPIQNPGPNPSQNPGPPPAQSAEEYRNQLRAARASRASRETEQ
jgi:hypothetical protein